MKTFLVYLAIASTLCLKAQYTITAASNPVPGDIQSSIPTYTSGLTLASSGTNKLWNYSTIAINSTVGVSSSTFVSLSSVPNNSLFSGATMGTDYGTNYYDVLKINGATFDYLGYATITNSACLVYSDPLTSLQIPFSYGSIFTDNYAYTDLGHAVTGTLTGNGSGTGTLVIPGYTLTNVLKVSITLNETNVFSTDTTTTLLIQDDFYSYASKFPLFSISNYTMSQTSSTIVSNYTTGAINNNISLNAGIEETSFESTFNIYPNPTNTKNISVNFTVKESTSADFKLFNNLGQVVKKTRSNNLSLGENKVNFNLENTPPGIYFLQIKTGEFESVKKLIIE